MKLFAQRVPRGLIAADAASEEVMAKIPVGKMVRLEVKQSRNIQHHRLYWALVKLLFENQETYQSEKQLHAVLKVMAGVCTPVLAHDGTVVMLPDSTDFESMDQAAFNEFFERVCAVVYKHIIPGLESDDLKAQIDSMINPSQQAAE